MDIQKILNESQSSVKLSRTTKGYTWEIKLYHFDDNEIIPRLKILDADLRKEYAPDSLKK